MDGRISPRPVIETEHGLRNVSPGHLVRHTKPLVIVAAVTGAEYHPSRFAAIPVTPADVARAAAASHDEGAGMIHIHARNPATGYQYADRSWYMTVRGMVDTMRPRLPISYPTSRKGEVEIQIRAAQEALRMRRKRELTAAEIVDVEMIRALGIQARPDTITTFTAPEIRMTGTASATDMNAATASYSAETAASWTRPDVMKLYYSDLRKLTTLYGVSEEVEITTMGAFDVIEAVATDPTLGISPTVHFVLLFGFSARLPITHASFKTAMQRVRTFARATGIQPAVTVGAVIRPAESARGQNVRQAEEPLGLFHDYREVFEWALSDHLVTGFRVGLEDTPFLYGQPRTNEWLVKHAVALCREYGVRVESAPAMVRHLLLKS